MERPLSSHFPDLWLSDLLSSKSARRGGVIRRKARDIERAIGLDRFNTEIRKRGYQAIRNGDMIVIFCNEKPIKRLV